MWKMIIVRDNADLENPAPEEEEPESSWAQLKVVRLFCWAQLEVVRLFCWAQLKLVVRLFEWVLTTRVALFCMGFLALTPVLDIISDVFDCGQLFLGGARLVGHHNAGNHLHERSFHGPISGAASHAEGAQSSLAVFAGIVV